MSERENKFNLNIMVELINGQDGEIVIFLNVNGEYVGLRDEIMGHDKPVTVESIVNGWFESIEDNNLDSDGNISKNGYLRLKSARAKLEAMIAEADLRIANVVVEE